MKKLNKTQSKVFEMIKNSSFGLPADYVRTLPEKKALKQLIEMKLIEVFEKETHPIVPPTIYLKAV